MINFNKITLFILFIILASSCGRKDDLYLPKEQKSSEKKQVLEKNTKFKKSSNY